VVAWWLGLATERSQVPVPAAPLHVQPWASCLHTCTSDTKQYKLIPAQAVAKQALHARGAPNMPLQCSAEAEVLADRAERVPKFRRTSAEYFASVK